MLIWPICGNFSPFFKLMPVLVTSTRGHVLELLFCKNIYWFLNGPWFQKPWKSHVFKIICFLKCRFPPTIPKVAAENQCGILYFIFHSLLAISWKRNRNPNFSSSWSWPLKHSLLVNNPLLEWFLHWWNRSLIQGFSFWGSFNWEQKSEPYSFSSSFLPFNGSNISEPGNHAHLDIPTTLPADCGTCSPKDDVLALLLSRRHTEEK